MPQNYCEETERRIAFPPPPPRESILEHHRHASPTYAFAFPSSATPASLGVLDKLVDKPVDKVGVEPRQPVLMNSMVQPAIRLSA